MQIKAITSNFSVSPQLAVSDVALVKAAGFTTLINNRPDGEDPAQPSGDAIAAEARRLGLAYHAIPLGRDGVSEQLVTATAEAIATASGPILAFCRSGTRSTTLWALAQRGREPVEAILAQATAAGYDISHLSGFLTAE